MSNTVEAGSLEEFVKLLCSKPPQEPCTQIMDIENATDPNELRTICSLIYMYMMTGLRGNIELVEKYFLSLGFRIIQCEPSDPILQKSNVVTSRIRLGGEQVLGFECIVDFRSSSHLPLPE